MKKLKIAALFLTLVVLANGILLHKKRFHFWRTDTEAYVSVDGMTLESPRVYQNVSGDILFIFEGLPYLIKPEFNDIQTTNTLDGSSFEIPGFLVVRDAPLGGVSFRDGVKMDPPREFTIDGQTASFEHIWGMDRAPRTLKVTWGGD